MSQSRRAFLQGVSTAAALGLLNRFPDSPLWAVPPDQLLPGQDDALLRELAAKAVEAGRAAGATFADVRVAIGQRLAVQSRADRVEDLTPQMMSPQLELMVGYGIRAVVDGAWGFAAGTELTADGVARTARAATARARANGSRRRRGLDLSPAPVVADGRWTATIERDPFTVPIGEQVDLQFAALSGLGDLPGLDSAWVGFSWRRSDRVFASTEGTLVQQRLAFAQPDAGVVARAGDLYPGAGAGVEDLERGAYGYEAVTRGDLRELLRHAAERAVAQSKAAQIPATPVEVGRYDLVLGAGAMAQLLTATLADALDAERALGYRANREGTSFAAPPDEILGKYQVGAPSLTVRADRTRPSGAATVGWDDEGVKPESFALIQGGVIVDYLTDRQTAPELAAWYRSRGDSVRSHGCASGSGLVAPGVQLPNLTLEPAREQVEPEDLIAATRRGFYLEGVLGASDQQVLNSQFIASPQAREIRNGKLGRRMKDLAFQFITPAFWKSLDALGGPATSITVLQSTGVRDDTLQLPAASVSVVPGLVRGVNVLNTGRMM